MLFARALLDKVLAWHAGPVLVALWAQYQSVVELVSGIALVGLGQGLTVFAARNEHAFGLLLRSSAAWGLAISGLFGILILLLLPLVQAWRETGDLLQAPTVVLAVLTGWVSVLPGMFLAFWQGRQMRGRMVGVLLVSWLPLLVTSVKFPGMPEVASLLRVQLATQTLLLAILLLSHWKAFWSVSDLRSSPVPRYLWAGISVGVLSPLSLIWLRAELASLLSWDEVAQLQAFWRVTEWVTGIVASVLFMLHLPGLAQPQTVTNFARQVQHIWRVVFGPAVVMLLIILLLRVPLVTFLYDSRFLMSSWAAALFILGDCLRIAAWVPLLILFARERVAAIALGEWLSLPLFAGLITVVKPSGLEGTAVLYVLVYMLYFIFNQTASSCRSHASAVA